MAKTKLNIVVSGAYGRMGREVVKAVSGAPDMKLVGAFDRAGVGEDSGEAAGIGRNGVAISGDLSKLLKSVNADVMVDFTIAEGFIKRAQAAVSAGAALVVGTTGIPQDVVKKTAALADAKKLGVIFAPNFAIGAVLMMKFAAMAAPYMPAAEIIELHHDKKIDSPSGTALYTAELMAAAKKNLPLRMDPTQTEKIPGARGASVGDISVHSVRLPGFLAHQEVIFGAPGQTLTIRHDTSSRESFMPGVLLAARKVVAIKKTVVGLENLV